MIILAVVFAVLGAASNAMGTAFQRKAAANQPRGGGLRLVLALAHRPAWLLGISGVIGAAFFQALALTNGPLALVQPVFILELPFALLIGLPLLHRTMPVTGWYAIGSVVAGLVLLLGCAAPHGGTSQATAARWIPAVALCLATMGLMVLIARRARSSLLRATVLGFAAAVGNALTAALLKSATRAFADHGPGAFFTSWQTYGFALTGMAALLLLENALQAGTLAASQPALTIGDATVSLLLGVFVFQERLHLGWLVLPELLGVALIAAGVLALTRAVPHIRDLAS
ncbi:MULTISPECIES: DMT family transporter [unclassified Streptomyces]|uniref:DMT family transporter n=1 Tax=unclassified Streptomyces TaxID=2593676 RepID=UPI000BACB30F|nr:DMT family transporter [Streptomyces sp. CLI2509]ASY33884.1 hypothetical protein CAC01_15425 [Streptomyces sp. CLI2509]MYX22594.1 hypothetical protein [Streptomyces sp. SID8380]